MDNQHKLIKGYRDLSQVEVEQINEVKDLAEKAKELVECMEGYHATDKRWVSIGKTHLQEGFSALVRSIAKPESF